MEECTILGTIHSTAFGKVILSKDKKGNENLMKTFRKDDFGSREAFEKEKLVMMALKRLRIKHVCQYIDAYNIPKWHVLVSRYYAGEDIRFHLRTLKHLTPHQTSFYAAVLLLTIQHLHINRIVHGDIHLGNVVIDETNGYPVLIDFSLSDFGVTNPIMKNNYSQSLKEKINSNELNCNFNYIRDFVGLAGCIFEMSTEKPKHLLGHPLDGVLSAEVSEVLNRLLNTSTFEDSDAFVAYITESSFFEKIHWEDLLSCKFQAPKINEMTKRFTESSVKTVIGLESD